MEKEIFYKIYEVFLPLLTVALTGIITFFITRYTQNNNIPLDKLQISYNRIYYPMYVLLRYKKYNNTNHQLVMDKINIILIKYDKYISPSTRISFISYLNASKKNHKHQFNKLTNNIFYYNNKLRRQLGYPQGSIIENYQYLSNKEKYTIHISICLLLIYISLMLSIVFYLNIFVYALIICFFIFLYMPIHCFFEYLFFKKM